MFDYREFRNKMVKKGYVYAFQNHFLPDLIKVGYTLKHPNERARELSSATGVPGYFAERNWWQVDNAKFMEKEIHRALREYRASKEFYYINKINVFDVIEEILMQYGEKIHDDNMIEFYEDQIKYTSNENEVRKYKQKLQRYLLYFSERNDKAMLRKIEMEKEDEESFYAGQNPKGLK